MFSYWLNFFSSGLVSFSYHFFNLLLHTVNALLVFLIVERLLTLVPIEGARRLVFSVLVMFLFLAHPLQTEAVSYIAGRSESLGAFFLLSAWCLFLYRPQPAISWKISLVVLALFALAVGSKENMIVLPAVLLVTDCFWNTSGWRQAIRANWRLYLPLLLGGAAGLVWVLFVLNASHSAGFRMKELTPLSYFFTETRAILSYIGLFVLPLGQSLDHQFAVSRNIFQHGAIIYLLVLATMITAAILCRKRFPLASFGFLVFLLLLSPTSSLVPIADPFVERRMYLPMFGLMLVVVEILSRMDAVRPPFIAVMGCLVISMSVATYHRNVLWSDPWLLWKDSVEHAPDKTRGYYHFATFAGVKERCQQTVPYLELADHHHSEDPFVLFSWAETFECLGQKEKAKDKLERATVVAPRSSAFELLGLLYGEMGQMSKAKTALDKAVLLAPDSESAYMSRGYWYEVMKEYQRAKSDYSKALQIDPTNFSARANVVRLDNKQFSPP